MNIESIVKDAVREALTGGTKQPSGDHPLIGQNVVVRARNAGVHYGKLESVGEFVHLKDSRRIWKWSGAFTLSELSNSGVDSGRIACTVPDLTIPVADIGEIIGLQDRAKTKLDAIHAD